MRRFGFGALGQRKAVLNSPMAQVPFPLQQREQVFAWFCMPTRSNRGRRSSVRVKGVEDLSAATVPVVTVPSTSISPVIPPHTRVARDLVDAFRPRSQIVLLSGAPYRWRIT